MVKKNKGLFINTPAGACSIYESGKMSYDCLVLSQEYVLDYVEVTSENRKISTEYDFYIFNYHWVKMGWLDTKALKSLPGFKATLVLEMSQNNPFDCVSKDDFDAYIVLDPTCKHFLTNVYAFPRPLESFSEINTIHENNEVPIIGTFGLSYADKGFDEVIKAVNKEFDQAIVRINVPKSENVSDQGLEDFKRLISLIELKDGIQVELQNNYFTKAELISWCSQNTLNVFLYNRRIGNGLSATTDQAIASGRPLSVSTNPTFRHIHSFIKPYPYLSLKEAIETTGPLVKKIQKEWSPESFFRHFEYVLKKNIGKVQAKKSLSSLDILLPILGNETKPGAKKQLFSKRFLLQFIPPVLLKIRNRILQRNLTHVQSAEFHDEAPVLKPFVHQVLQSSSQFQEDLLIDFLLNQKDKGTYVDIGANDPFFNSNTRRFYERGWRGINIEPGISEFKKIAKYREFDINLNVAVANEEGKLTFYQIGNDSSLSTLDYNTALSMSDTYKMELISSTVDVIPLSKILDNNLNGRKIDFMSVDAEGYDLVVLKSNNWEKYRPSIVMVESNSDSRNIIMFMDRQNYLYIYSNHVNAIFIDKMTNDQDILRNIVWNK